MTLPNRRPCLLAAGLLVLLAAPAWAQSFNCHKAFFADERTICGEPRLGHLDSQLATLFGHVISRLPPPQRAALKREETAWVVARRRCGHNGHCLAGFYDGRIQQLQAMLAVNEHLAAGPSRRVNPQTNRERVAVGSTEMPNPSDSEPTNTAVSGRATPMIPPANFDIEPEVSPVGQGSSGESAGGPMTPVR